MVRRALAVVLLATLAGCPTAPAPRRRQPTLRAPRVAVLPFRAGGVLGREGEFAQGSETEADVAEIGEEFARALTQHLAERGFAVVNPDAVAGAVTLGASRSYDSRLATRVAMKLGAPLAVLGAVSRYRQRVGTAWAVETPASVAYDAALVRASDGAILRHDRFDYTQRALSENLLDLPRFVEGGGRWLTREEILAAALRDTAGRFAAAAGD